jgi:urea carboxylase
MLRPRRRFHERKSAVIQSRYTFGGDEHLFVEMDEAMSLKAFFRALGVCNAIRDSRIDGVTEICPANASLLLRFDPDIIKPQDLLDEVTSIEAAGAGEIQTLKTRILELPVYYNDPWTHETLMRFRDRHQDPSVTDLEYAARINNYPDVDAFIAAHSSSPWFVSMVGFVAGCPFMFQMVERKKQLQVPKYVRPRTDTPKLCVAHGGCFSAIYPVRGAGGYQMLGITPLPIYDPKQETSYLRKFMILFRPGDIVKWRPIGRQEYDSLIAEVAAGSFFPREKQISFSLEAFDKAPATYNRQILEVLNGR